MHGSAGSKNTASGGKKQKLVVSSFVSGDGAREAAGKLVGKIVKSNLNAGSHPNQLHT